MLWNSIASQVQEIRTFSLGLCFARTPGSPQPAAQHQQRSCILFGFFFAGSSFSNQDRVASTSVNRSRFFLAFFIKISTAYQTNTISGGMRYVQNKQSRYMVSIKLNFTATQIYAKKHATNNHASVRSSAYQRATSTSRDFPCLPNKTK